MQAGRAWRDRDDEVASQVFRQGAVRRLAAWHQGGANGGGLRLALVGVLVLLTVLNRDARPSAVVALLAHSGVLWCLRSRVRRRGRQDRLLAEEAARGVAQLERWLVTGPRA